MRLRRLGNSAVKVSEVSLGSWLSIGGKQSDEKYGGSPSIEEKEVGFKILEKAVETGINFVDTAPGYGKGYAERMIGEFLKDYDRDDFVIATKVFFPVIRSDLRFGTSKKSIHVNLKASLDRLQTNYVDVYYCHQYDHMGRIEETIRAMNHMIDQGKILYWATSNWSAAEIERAYGICRAEGLQPPIVEQTKYNLLNREIELSHKSTLDYTGMGITVYSPLEEGILTGKYNNGKPSDSRFQKLQDTVFKDMTTEFFNKVLTEENLVKLRKIEELSKELGITMGQLSLAWLLSKDYVSSVIAGASKIEHVEDNSQASRINLEKDTILRIEEIMDNEPQFQGEHSRWSYQQITKFLKEHNNRIPSISYAVKQAEKEKLGK